MEHSSPWESGTHTAYQEIYRFYGTRSSLLCSQESATGPSPKSDEYSHTLKPCFITIHYNISFPPKLRFQKYSLPFRFTKNNSGSACDGSHLRCLRLPQIGVQKTTCQMASFRVEVLAACIIRTMKHKHLCKAGKLPLHNTAQQPTIQPASYSPPWKPQISFILSYLVTRTSRLVFLFVRSRVQISTRGRLSRRDICLPSFAKQIPG